MQVMPDTAKWIAGKLRMDNYSLEQLYEPETNIRFGCWYLNYLSSLFSGDPLCVVCAYHAGQGEISSWLSNPLYSDNGYTLIEDRLPEGPTKQYAGRVTRDYGIYQAKYFSDLQPAGGVSAPVSP
jgi:soluble lytic murein transglycosylase